MLCCRLEATPYHVVAIAAFACQTARMAKHPRQGRRHPRLYCNSMHTPVQHSALAGTSKQNTTREANHSPPRAGALFTATSARATSTVGHYKWHKFASVRTRPAPLRLRPPAEKANINTCTGSELYSAQRLHGAHERGARRLAIANGIILSATPRREHLCRQSRLI